MWNALSYMAACIGFHWVTIPYWFEPITSQEKGWGEDKSEPKILFFIYRTGIISPFDAAYEHSKTGVGLYPKKYSRHFMTVCLWDGHHCKALIIYLSGIYPWNSVANNINNKWHFSTIQNPNGNSQKTVI